MSEETALVGRKALTPDQLTPFAARGVEELMRFADMLAKSNLIPDPLRGKPADVMVILLKGHDLGLSATQALGGIHVIKGKAVSSADMMVGLCLKSPVCLYFRCVETSETRAVYETMRQGDPEPSSMAWDITMAKRAKLDGKDNWRNHPDAMLRARCKAALARDKYPDVVAGIYTHDEIGGGTLTGEVMDARVIDEPTPPPKPRGSTRPKPGESYRLHAATAEDDSGEIVDEPDDDEPIGEPEPEHHPTPEHNGQIADLALAVVREYRVALGLDREATVAVCRDAGWAKISDIGRCRDHVTLIDALGVFEAIVEGGEPCN